MKICIITYSFYESDPRVRREAESLAERGDEVDVICLWGSVQKKRDYLNGVNVYRIQRRQINEKCPIDYLKKLFSFFFLSSVTVTMLSLIKRYDLIHVVSEPDFLVFAAFIPRLFGTKVILDIHELVPELYARKFSVNSNHIIVKFLKWIEKISTRFANHVITVTNIWKDTLVSRSIPESKCTVLLNVPNPRIFRPTHTQNESETFTIVCRGVFSEIFGLDIAIRAMDILRAEIPSARLEIFGHGLQGDMLLRLIEGLKLEKFVHLNKGVPINEWAEFIQRADIGIETLRNGVYAGECLSQAVLEFMATGIPVIVSKTKASQTYFDESMVSFFEPGNYHDLACCIIELYNDRGKRQRLVNDANQFIKEHSREHYKKTYYDLVDTLCRG